MFDVELLRQQARERRRLQHEESDEVAWASPNPAQALANNLFNRRLEGGYVDRQWAPFFEAMQGKEFGRGSLGGLRAAAGDYKDTVSTLDRGIDGREYIRQQRLAELKKNI